MILLTFFIILSVGVSENEDVCQNLNTQDEFLDALLCHAGSNCSGRKIECEKNSNCTVQCNGNHVCDNLVINGEQASKVNIIFESNIDETTTNNITVKCPIIRTFRPPFDDETRIRIKKSEKLSNFMSIFTIIMRFSPN